MSTPAATSIARYDIDPQDTAAMFKVRHPMISNVKGEFTKVTGSIGFDPSKQDSASLEVTIDAASINAGEPDRDTHLKSADFLEVARYPRGFFRRGASASATFSRKDFGLVWNMALETGGVVVGDEVHITIDAELARNA